MFELNQLKDFFLKEENIKNNIVARGCKHATHKKGTYLILQEKKNMDLV